MLELDTPIKSLSRERLAKVVAVYQKALKMAIPKG